MLRISTDQDDRCTTLRLEGVLADSAVPEVEKRWHRTLDSGTGSLRLDLFGTGPPLLEMSGNPAYQALQELIWRSL